MTLDEFYAEFMQGIYASAGANSDFFESVFAENMCEFLESQGIVDDYALVQFKKTSLGMRLDAASYDEESERMTLIVADFRPTSGLESLSLTDIEKSMRRAERFFTESKKTSFYQTLEESSPGYAWARQINEKAPKISRIQVIVISNAELSKRVGALPEVKLDGYRTSLGIWDIGRLFQVESSGKAEDMVMDFSDTHQDGIPCLHANCSNGQYESYLLIVPGKLLADLYDEYGDRLLEQNVRTFLQFRGKVNKGIRNTIIREPSMFFAYNNGLSATAEGVTLNQTKTGIKSITNFQIVNGGQTTASIFTAMKNKYPLSDVFIQVKLNVIPPSQVESVVPRISEYANTQNKVTASDFFSNHPFHLRLEQFSRRLWARSRQGGLRDSHWFYERTRGQYANAQANLTEAQKREFLTKNPKIQMFTKTDLAKYEQSMGQLPQIVSRHAQKSFANYAHEIGERWSHNPDEFNELYFKRIVGEAILFRFLDSAIPKQDWYAEYKAQIVTYTIAKFSSMVQSSRKYIDLLRVWNEQEVSEPIKRQLLGIAQQVNKKIQETPEGKANVQEWCKRDGCWQSVQNMPIALSPDVLEQLVDKEEIDYQEKSGRYGQALDNGIEAQKYVLEKNSQYWRALRQWNLQIQLLSPKESGILDVACDMPPKIPSEKQCQVLIAIEKRVLEEGFPGVI
jgi:hypothetical protein